MQKYLSISEVAKYAGISRRTLIYYDEIDLFKPNKIGENGYRYYTVDQYPDLDVILVLRALEMSLEDIKKFLQHRNPQASRRELMKQQEKLDKQIKKMMLTKQSLDRQLERYEKLATIDLTTITLEEKAAEHFIFSDVIHSYADISCANIYSEFYSYIEAEDLFNGHPLGFMTVNDEDYRTDFHNLPYQILVMLDEDRLTQYDQNYIITKPAGTYVSGFMTNEPESLIDLQNRLSAFLEENNLEVTGKIWELLWQDETLATNDAELIFEVSIQVKQ